MSTTTSKPPTIATHPLTNRSLDELRSFEVLKPYFEQLDAGEPANWIISGALYFDNKVPVVGEFAIAVLRERLGAELEPEDELTELALVEMLDPAKSFPPGVTFPPDVTRHKAALLVLATPTATDAEMYDNRYMAHYLTDEPNIGLAVSMNDIRARYGLEPTGW